MKPDDKSVTSVKSELSQKIILESNGFKIFGILDAQKIFVTHSIFEVVTLTSYESL